MNNELYVLIQKIQSSDNVASMEIIANSLNISRQAVNKTKKNALKNLEKYLVL